MIKDAEFEKEFIYIPLLNLHFSKEVSFGTTWHETHRLLQSQGSKMPTILEYLGFLKYLKNSKNQEEIEVYKKIVEPGAYLRGEWLDAAFSIKNNSVSIHYNHILKNGNLIPMNSELLKEDTLMKDLRPGISLEDWIFNPTKQGLPKKECKKGEIYYWYPRGYNNSVARLVSNSVWTYFSCGANPSNHYMKVRVVKNPDSF